jgi:hypothetical protein
MTSNGIDPDRRAWVARSKHQQCQARAQRCEVDLRRLLRKMDLLETILRGERAAFVAYRKRMEGAS